MTPITPHQRGAISVANEFATNAPVQLAFLNAWMRYALAKLQLGLSRFDIISPQTLTMLPLIVVASFASYMNRKRGPDEPPFAWFSWFAHLSASVVAGLTVMHIAQYYGVTSLNALCTIAILAAWSSKDGINWVVYVVRMKVLSAIGMTKAADRETHRYASDSQSPVESASANTTDPKDAKYGSKEEFMKARAERKEEKTD